MSLHCADVLFLIKKIGCCWEGIVFQNLTTKLPGSRTELSDLLLTRCSVAFFSRAMLEATSSPVVFCHNDCQEGKLLIFQYCSVMYC